MSKMLQVYGNRSGFNPCSSATHCLLFETAPNSKSNRNYEIGQIVYTPTGVATDFYIYAGAGNWIHLQAIQRGL